MKLNEYKYLNVNATLSSYLIEYMKVLYILKNKGSVVNLGDRIEPKKRNQKDTFIMNCY